MFIPCDHCLRKHATHASEVNDLGEPESLKLCKDCFERLKEDLARLHPPTIDPKLPIAQREEAIAQALQASLLPRKLPSIPGYDLSAWFRPSQAVDGDYYDLIEIDGDHLGLVVAGVSAKGIPASIINTETRALLRSEARPSRSPAETLARVNRVLHQDIKRGMFVTLFYVILDIPQATLTCVSAGHNPMIHWRKDADVLRLINPNGLALGFDQGPLFERTVKEEKVVLSPGDRFTIYTDGAIEAMNERNVEFGQDQFYLKAREYSNHTSEDFLKFLVRDIDRHRGNVPQHADIAIVTGRYKGRA